MKRTPLKRKAGLSRGQGIRRSPSKQRHRRRQEELEVFRALVLKRAGHQCQRCGWRPKSPEQLRDLHAHHLLTRARGGTNDPSNGAALCFRCHGAVHDHTAPDWQRWLMTTRQRRSDVEQEEQAPAQRETVFLGMRTTARTHERLIELCNRAQLGGITKTIERALDALERELEEAA